MQSIIIKATALGLFSALALTVPAEAAVSRVPGPWDLTGSYVIDLTCISGCSGVYTHTMNVTSMNLMTGNFSGTGYYNSDTSYTWTISGTIVGSMASSTIVYTGTNAGHKLTMTGAIASNGMMSGSAISSAGQTFKWQTVSGAAKRFTGNHGQYIKSQQDKKLAAQSRIGMPCQSKGHTKSQ